MSQAIAVLSDRACQGLWSFLDLKDVVNLSGVSRGTRTIPIGEIAGANFIGRFRIAEWKISSFQVMKLIHMCRILRMIHSPMEVFLLFDDRNGRLLLDLGSTDGPLLAPQPEVSQEEEEEEDSGSQNIFRQLEKASYDEYDDFQPRHPMPKDRAHRRGDSYFNSDIETVVSELGAMSGDLRNLARSALESGNDQPPMSSGTAAKNRILARTRNNYPGGGSPSPKQPGLPPTAPRRRPDSLRSDASEDVEP